MRAANDVLRFSLEIGTLVSVAYWGWSETDSWWRWLLVVASPLLVAVVWGRFMAPKSTTRVGDPRRLLLELLIFGSAVAALTVSGQGVWAAVFGGLALLHLALTFPLDQRRID